MIPTELGKRKMKQKYLREQIVEQEFDPEEFTKFLSDRRDDGRLTRGQRGRLGHGGTGAACGRVQVHQDPFAQ